MAVCLYDKESTPVEELGKITCAQCPNEEAKDTPRHQRFVCSFITRTLLCQAALTRHRRRHKSFERRADAHAVKPLQPSLPSASFWGSHTGSQLLSRSARLAMPRGAGENRLKLDGVLHSPASSNSITKVRRLKRIACTVLGKDLCAGCFSTLKETHGQKPASEMLPTMRLICTPKDTLACCGTPLTSSLGANPLFPVTNFSKNS